MTLNASGPISLGGTTTGQSIEVELGGGGTTQISLNCTNVRTLACAPSGAVIMPTNFYGKSSASYWISQVALSNSYIGARGMFFTGSGGVAAMVDGSLTVRYYKYNSSGVFQNSTTINIGGFANGLYSFAVSDGTNYYFAGYTGSNTAVFYKLNSSLSPQWAKTITMGYTTGQGFNSIAVDSSGNLYGFFYVGGGSYPQPEIVKYDTNGNLQYQVSINPNSVQKTQGQFYAGAVSPNGSYLYGVSAYFFNDSPAIYALDPSTGAVTSGYAYTYSASNIRINRSSAGTPFLAVSNSNNIYYVASTNTTSYTGSPYIGIIIKFSSGNLSSYSWSRTLTRPGSPYGPILQSSMCIDSSENVYAVFRSQETQAQFVLYIVKYNSSGTLLWQRQLSFFQSSYNVSSFTGNPNVTVDNNGAYYISGSFGAPTGYDTVIKFPDNGNPTGLFISSAPTAIEFIYTASNLTDASATINSTSLSPFTNTTLSQTTSSVSATSSTTTYTYYTTTLTFTSGWGSATFRIPGTYTWIAPAGVTKVSVVAIGGGGAGYVVPSVNNYTSGGGGAGGLGYINNYCVTPGNSYTVVVGAGAYPLAGTATAGDSYFISTSVVKGGKGSNGTTSTSVAAAGGSYTGTGGGNGGNGGIPQGNHSSGGGGAGGYSGNGGAGAGGGSSAGGSGSGGGAGGGSQCSGAFGYPCGNVGKFGGNVWIIGQGSNGAGGASYANNGAGGSYGLNGNNFTIGGGASGGGAAYFYPAHCCCPATCGTLNYPGSCGVVRIIWPGCSRTFPSTNTGNF
jgi:hypothetical protein